MQPRGKGRERARAREEKKQEERTKKRPSGERRAGNCSTSEREGQKEKKKTRLSTRKGERALPHFFFGSKSCHQSIYKKREENKTTKNKQKERGLAYGK